MPARNLTRDLNTLIEEVVNLNPSYEKPKDVDNLMLMLSDVGALGGLVEKFTGYGSHEMHQDRRLIAYVSAMRLIIGSADLLGMICDHKDPEMTSEITQMREKLLAVTNNPTMDTLLRKALSKRFQFSVSMHTARSR